MAVKLDWDEAATQRVAKAPFFVRKLIRHKVEKAARERGLTQVTEALLDEIKQKQMDKQGS